MICWRARFNRYSIEYNQYRPHEALDDATPSSCYAQSPRRYTGQVYEFDYPSHFDTRKVRADGNIKWHQVPIYVANLLAGEYIGLEPIDDRCWMVYLSNMKLGILDERNKKIIRPGQWIERMCYLCVRAKVLPMWWCVQKIFLLLGLSK